MFMDNFSQDGVMTRLLTWVRNRLVGKSQAPDSDGSARFRRVAEVAKDPAYNAPETRDGQPVSRVLIGAGSGMTQSFIVPNLVTPRLWSTTRGGGSRK